MTNLEQLINELCPDGVEYKTLGEIGEFYSGLTGKSKEDFKDGNALYITYMNVFTNLDVNTDIPDKVKVSSGERQNIVRVGDVLFTGSSETPEECGMAAVLTKEIDEPLYLNSFCFGFRLFDQTLLIPGFSKYLFRSDALRKQIVRTASGVTRFNVSKEKMKKVKIPLPPLPVQREIVRILGNFTELTAELTAELAAELAARKQQYEYYRDFLFNFENTVHWLPLGQIADIGTGSSNTNEELEVGEYPFFVRSQEVRRKDTFEYDETAIITSGDGVGVGKIFHFVEGKYALHQRAYRIHIRDERVLPKYYFYYMRSAFLPYIQRNAVNSSVTSIRRRMLDEFPVPIPSISEQARIVDILDRFDKLCNDISEGLPAEIEARRKQYEYYRDKLLTFKEAGA
jgi:type I restriction enzyme S subunit